MKNRFKADFAGNNYFIPLLIILTLVGIINAIQYYNFNTDMSGVTKFLSISIAKLIYNWYYLLLLLLLPVFYKTFVKRRYLDWWIYSILTLLLFLFFHQVVALIVDLLFLGKHTPKPLYELLVDNQAVWIDIVLYILFISALYLIEYKKVIHEKELRQARLEVKLLESRLTELRMKIQPQFLFKILYSIDGYVKTGKTDEANRLLSLLSEFLRTNIYETDSDFATLEDEISFLKLYSEIEESSGNSGLSLHVEPDTEKSGVKVPRFLIQTIIEEILKNSSISLQERNINLKVINSDSKCKLTIYTSLCTDMDIIKSSPLIRIAKDRLSKLYKDQYEILFNEKDGDLTEIIIELPCEIPDSEE